MLDSAQSCILSLVAWSIGKKILLYASRYHWIMSSLAQTPFRNSTDIPVCFSAQLTHTCTFEILYLVYLHPTPNGLLQILLWHTSSCLYLFSTTYTKTSVGTFWSMLTGLFGNYINTHMRYVRHFHPNFILIGTTLISDIPWHIWNIYLNHIYHLCRLTKYLKYLSKSYISSI